MAAIIIVTLLCSAPGQAVPDSVRPDVREAWLARAGIDCRLMTVRF